MSEIKIEDKKVVTGKFRVSFPALEKAKSVNGSEPKFGMTMLFAKDADLSEMKRAAENARIERWGADKSKWPTRKLKSGKVVSALKSPFRDGDVEKPDMEGYKGTIFVTASAKEGKQPGIVDRNREPIDPKEVYAGCYARATLIAFAYPQEGVKGFGNMGVSFALQNVQKWSEGKKFGGKKDAKDDFDAIEDDSDDPESYEAEETADAESGEDDLGF